MAEYSEYRSESHLHPRHWVRTASTVAALPRVARWVGLLLSAHVHAITLKCCCNYNI